MKIKHQQIVQKLRSFANLKQALILQRFFKTGKGEYGEGDVFLGIKVPVLRSVAKDYMNLSLHEVEKLLNTKIHEQRLVALLIWTYQYPLVDQKQQKAIYTSYMRHTAYINNWDLVDVTAPLIVGKHLLSRPRTPLYTFAKSNNIWKKRIAIISTFTFLRDGQYADTIRIAELLLNDQYDLIHKAVGWMLREVGKRDKKTEVAFLNKHASRMPRTMLRYAIEKFPKAIRQSFLRLN